jgi:Tol biopolymer transport system component
MSTLGNSGSPFPAWSPDGKQIVFGSSEAPATLKAAKQLVRRAGCVLGSVGGPKKDRSRLHVVKQNPGANRNVPTGTKVNVRLG